MQSTIAICNVALTSYLGTRSITSFSDGSPEAEQCELHYDRVRQSLLERWPWVFATRREALVQNAINDRSGVWGYSYARPANIIAIRWVNGLSAMHQAGVHGRSPDSYREMTATTIYSNVPNAVIEYTRDETDPTLFSPAFCDVLAANLAAAMAMAITRDASKVTAAQENAARLLNQAMVLDFNARPSTAQEYIPEGLRVRGIGSNPIDEPLPTVSGPPPMNPLAPPGTGVDTDYVAIFEAAKNA